ncbi:biotin--[acetyl-CoA-carboxylase] ligase [candidate division KSB1 bacterium]|nr:biotin--[acetyl-CoA-carboxylase] ligase [candidate division KSB1 bacterium]
MKEPQIIQYQRVTSTNDVAKMLLRNQCSEETLITAEEQTHGRGRHQRRWFSAKGLGLYMSLIYKPVQMEAYSAFALFPACAVSRAVKNLSGIQLKLKWPNDIMYDGNKVGGILIESVFKQTHPLGLVVGMGLNLYHQNEDLTRLPQKSVSLSSFSKQKIDKNALMTEIVHQMQSYYSRGRLCIDPDRICREWNQLCCHLFKSVTISTHTETYTAIFKGIRRDGGAILDKQGQEIIIYSGECSLSEMSACF